MNTGIQRAEGRPFGRGRLRRPLVLRFRERTFKKNLGEIVAAHEPYYATLSIGHPLDS